MPHMENLYRFALKITGDRYQAEDLLQETMLKAFRSFHQYRRGTNCKAWLFAIMRNHYGDLYRKRGKDPLYHAKTSCDSDGDEIGFEFQDTGMDTELIKSETGEVVRKSLNYLDEVYRLPVILKDLEGFSYKEISRILGCPTGTVMSRLYRGRNLLKKEIIEKFEKESLGGKIIQWKNVKK